MRRKPRGNPSEVINAMFADPNRDEIQFWQHLEDYVGSLCNRLMKQDLLQELVQDVLIQVFKSLPRFKPNPDYPGSSFTRWVSGICKRRSWDLYKQQFSKREIAISQLGTFIHDDTEWDEYDFTEVEDATSAAAFDEALAMQTHDQEVSARLDTFRSRLTDPIDVQLFDLMRAGSTRRAAAGLLGVSQHQSDYRSAKWKQLARNPEQVQVAA